MPRAYTKYTLQEAKTLASNKGGQFLSKSFNLVQDKYTWQCAEGHEWDATFQSVYMQGTWCNLCYQAERTSAQRSDFNRSDAMQLLENLLEEQQVSYQRFNATTRTDFAVTNNIELDAWLFMSVIKADKSGVVRLDRRVDGHVTVIYPAVSDGNVVILDVCQKVEQKNPRYILLQETVGFCSYATISSKLMRLASVTSSLHNLKEIQFRSEPAGNDSFAGEETTNILLTRLLGGSWKRTSEGCRADGYFQPYPSRGCLPVQLKTTMSESSRPGWSIKSPYPSCLCLLHSTASQHLLLVPGGDLGTAQKVFLSLDCNGQAKQTKYSKYIVAESEVSSFFQRIWDAINESSTLLQWPSGCNSTLEGLTLRGADELNTPQHATGRIEYEHAQFRLSQFGKQLEFVRPPRDNDHYDYSILQRRIQEKCAQKVAGNGWSVSVSKTKTGYKNQRQPYHMGDFHALWVYVDHEIFYLIPATAMQRYLQTGSNKGLTGLSVYPKGSGMADTWANKYLLYFNDDNAAEKVRKILESIDI